MTRAIAMCGLLAASGLAGCAPTPAPQPAAPPQRDLVVLAAQPESGEIGRLVVTTSSGTVELARAGESTTVTAGGPPGAVVVLDDAVIRRHFGAALAVQPPAARHFNLYFEVGGNSLTTESRVLVAEVVVTVQGRVAPDVSVTGHTDTTGSAESNVTLGLRRAGLIRDLLVQAGLNPSVIDVVSHGESDLLFATPDNTAEARNRRVEVTVR